MADHKKAVDSKQRAERDGYDRNLIPGETAARIEREGEGYKQQAEEAGFTVDNEGLANNYAVEPEMYYEERGDLRAKEEAQAVERAKELADINNNEEDGKLTMEDDKRGKGVGFI
ncbi:hypothetical protein [Mastigocoleus testarum]|uniref:Uncharacterized protein n=1 Tax=Mastigocoleus testarum BC008 TaxID=371196 RepID=A0A0V7ZXA4_9CYAN|nr:hypothetical protein [Mastigocoleus testarum]KST63717.1 hypothetical protein BC008_14765 [Mastigocoleus testarum BC008]KST69219.1 hypothetical protein BC008_03250 [Mastigocoleus testarum BC008]